MPTPSLPKYGPNSLRPNPTMAMPEKGVLAYAQETQMVGDFGDSWDASARVTNGLPGALPAPKHAPLPKQEEHVKQAKGLRRPANT